MVSCKAHNLMLKDLWVRLPPPQNIASWCNGNTRVFGALFGGSNPSGAELQLYRGGLNEEPQI